MDRTSPDEVLALIGNIWTPLNPDQAVEWRRALSEMDLEVAQRAALVLRDAHPACPSLGLFAATYRGLLKTRAIVPAPLETKRIDASWFEEQRAKLRPREDSHPET